MPLSNPLLETDIDNLVAGGGYQQLYEYTAEEIIAALIGAFWGIKVTLS